MRGCRASAVRIFMVLAGASGTWALQEAMTAPLSRSASTHVVVRTAGGLGAPGCRSTCSPGRASRSPPTEDAGAGSGRAFVVVFPSESETAVAHGGGGGRAARPGRVAAAVDAAADGAGTAPTT